MIYYTPSGSPIKTLYTGTDRFYSCVTTSSNYAVSPFRHYRYTEEYVPPKNAPYTEKWQNEFYFLAKDFEISIKKITDIIYEVASAAKPTDTDNKLYIRATNKMYDLI